MGNCDSNFFNFGIIENNKYIKEFEFDKITGVIKNGLHFFTEAHKFERFVTEQIVCGPNVMLNECILFDIDFIKKFNNFGEFC